ncbi:hypothetical protein Atai01_53850 [Amycolatopsis taiwanensis]|uniref:HTH gntR-type domain-containing protein n=2 Tax=Amycolatopsis taiwanensis TaxID=342230 RepID=A0A9W6VJQ7_9PSEU|nr:hypothetical protein Atai01_53850 [Amycolatopsis taiwanensis]
MQEFSHHKPEDPKQSEEEIDDVAVHDLEFDPKAYRWGYLYVAVADHFTNLIKTGVLKRGNPLPAESRFRSICGVSLGTARRAVQELRERGLVTTLPSKGTFVTYGTTTAERVDSHPL